MRYVDWASGLLIEKKQERNFRFVSVIPEKIRNITCIRFPFYGIISLGDSAASLSAGGRITIF